jgi:hypothetical protein
MPGGPGQEPLGRILTAAPSWSRHIAPSATEAWFLFYYQYRLDNVYWPCPRCHAPSGLALRGKAVGRTTRWWLRCTSCSARVVIATRAVLTIAQSLNLPPPRYFYRHRQ